MKHQSDNKGFTLLELIIVTVVIAVLITLAMPSNRIICSNGSLSKSLSNAKEIAKACILFAYENDGKFPDGSYNNKKPGGMPGLKSHECFADVIQSGLMKQEAYFWNAKATHVCSKNKPNENGKLEAGECAYDYVSGIKYIYSEKIETPQVPLVFEACTTAGTKWDKGAGHPWDKKVIVVNLDGSGDILATDKNHSILVNRPVGSPAKETKVDLVGAATAAQEFPAGAYYAPAK